MLKRPRSEEVQAPKKRAKMQQVLKIGSWNICGLRAILKKGHLQSFLSQYNPDIFCLNETMMTQKAISQVVGQLPEQYNVYWNCSDKRQGYSGVALLTKEQPSNIQYGLYVDKDEEGRVIIAEYNDFFIIGTYVPNVGSELCRMDFRIDEWDVQIRQKLGELQQIKPVIWMGDMNVVHLDHDIYDIKGKEKWGCCTPQERNSFNQTLVDNDLIDTFRYLHPDLRNWSYYSRRNVKARYKGQGWRLDYIVVSKSIAKRVSGAHIRSDIMGSDHHPVLLELINNQG